MTNDHVGLVLLEGEQVIDFVFVPQSEMAAFQQKMSEEGIEALEVTPYYDVWAKKQAKKDAITHGLLYGWKPYLFAKLADCDDVVPRNLLVALTQKYPYVGLTEGMTYRELFAVMEGLD